MSKPGPRPERDRAILRSLPELFGIETLSARYVKQSFEPHAHDEYVFGVIEAGVHAVWCRGEMNMVPGGSVVTMRPGNVHHGGADHEAGWRQRMIYIPEAGMCAFLADLTGREMSGTLDFAAAFHARPALACRFAGLHKILQDTSLTLAHETALPDGNRATVRLRARMAASVGTRNPADRGWCRPDRWRHILRSRH